MDRGRRDSSESPRERDAEEPLPDDLHWMLADPRRCAALALLRERESATLGELADEVAESADESYERSLVALDRHHLPVMAETGLLDYDRSNERATLADLPDRTRQRIDRAVREG